MSEAKEWREWSIDDMTPRQQLALAVRQACVGTRSEPARLAYAEALQAGTGEIDAGGARHLVAKLKELARAGKMPQAEYEAVADVARAVERYEKEAEPLPVNIAEQAARRRGRIQ